MVGFAGDISAVLLAPLAVLPRVAFPMRRSLRIRTEFEPTRLSAEYLRSAYEMTVPIARRVVNVASTDDERDVAVGVDRVEGATVRSSAQPRRNR
jgi:hypothetical protein